MATRNVIKMMIAMISVWREADDDGGNEGGWGHCDGCCDRGNNDDHGGNDETDVVCRQVVLQGRVRGPNNQPHTVAEGCLH